MNPGVHLVTIVKVRKNSGWRRLRPLHVINDNSYCRVLWRIECKRYGRRNSVGVSIVRSLYGVQTSDQINKSILVTTGHVTRGARRFVEKQNTMMSILDVNEIHHLIQRSAMKYR